MLSKKLNEMDAGLALAILYFGHDRKQMEAVIELAEKLLVQPLDDMTDRYRLIIRTQKKDLTPEV